MHLTAVIVATSAICGVSALPWQGSGSQKSVGAAYLITNDPVQNMIISSSIAIDGTLTFGKAINAGGRGLHGATADPNASDGLFSQGAIEVSGEYVYTINAGSNTAAMFAINPTYPEKLQMIGNPVSTGGEFPMSIAVSQKGMVCVLNGGAVSNINCFKPDPKLGLVMMQNSIRTFGLNQTTPPTGPAGTTSHILFNTAGDKLLASIKGVPPTPGFVAAWSIAPSGAVSANFSRTEPGPGGLLPFGMANIPNKNAVIVTDPAIGFEVFDLSKPAATPKVFPIAGQKAICWTSFSKATGTFFLTDGGTSVVTEVAVDDQLNGKIIKQYPQAVNSTTLDTAVGTVGGKDYLYVLSAGKTTVNVLALPKQGGAIKVQDFNVAAAAAKQATVSAANIQGMAVFIKS